MNPRKGLVLDANIMLRAVFGIRVRQILETYEDGAAFYSPDVCFAEAKRYIPNVAKRRKLDSRLAQSILEHVSHSSSRWTRACTKATKSLLARESNVGTRDWPVVAVALLLGIPVWTEDQDFFGSGVSTWTTDRVEVYLREPA